MEDRKRLSRWVYSVLENVGASEMLRQLHRQTAVTEEILYTIYFSFRHGKFENTFYCGSRFEGTVSPALASDEDIIGCQSDHLVVLDVAAAPLGVSHLMVRDSWTYPGYVKLQGVVGGRPLYDYHRLPLEQVDVDFVGRICLKHLKTGNMHGPADMQFDENGVHVRDVVPAFRCDYIPQCALEWIFRPRPYGWPTSYQLEAMSRMGCMVVGVGHVNSGEKEIEWRMSYTLQERMLMSSLNPVQHKVYILLKMLKKDILGNKFHGETLTSYHFKTCVLYAVQMSPACVWTKENIINCLVWCLKLMLNWLKNHYCPSFLTKYQNLFIKEGFSELRKGLIIEMHKLIESGHQYLYMIQSDNVGAILRNGDWRMYREVATYAKNKYIFQLKINCVTRSSQIGFGILRFISDEKNDTCILTFFEKMKSARHILNHTIDVTQSALAYLLPNLHLHVAKGLASFTHICPDISVREQVMKLVGFHLHEARGVDQVNERLAAATVLYTFEKYEECSPLLHLIERDFTYQVIQVCPCTGKSTVVHYDIQDKNEMFRKGARMTIRHLIKSMIACCVVFLPHSSGIAPEPLQYEMQRSLGTTPGSRDENKDFWFDWAVVDAKVYLFFMQYIVSSKLHKDVDRYVARDNLRKEIAWDDLRVMSGQKSRLGHKDTAYNLLGWIYMQEELMAEAYSCFHASWERRSYHNAAKYHMRDMLVTLAERRV